MTQRRLGNHCLVVHAHPVSESFNTALRNSVVEGLLAAGNQVRSVDLYAEGFEPVLSDQEWTSQLGLPSTRPDFTKHVEHLRWCNHLVLIYPTWWSSTPAMLKGWFDQIWVNDVLSTHPSATVNIPSRLDNVERLSVVTTHGSGLIRNYLQGFGGKRMILRGLRSLCSRQCRTDWIAMYHLDTSTLRQRTRFMKRVQSRLTP